MFINPLVNYILKKNINYYILDLPNRKLIYNSKVLIDKSNKVSKNMFFELIGRILFGLKIILFMKLDYNIVHILSWKLEKIILFKFLKKKSIKIVNIYGEKDVTNMINNFFLKLFSNEIHDLVFSNKNFYENFKII